MKQQAAQTSEQLMAQLKASVDREMTEQTRRLLRAARQLRGGPEVRSKSMEVRTRKR